MRLYFTDGTHKIGIDTKEEAWTDERDTDFMRDDAHTFIKVSEDDLNRILGEVYFNCYGYSRELLPWKDEDEEPAELPFC